MTLEDFERELAESRRAREGGKEDRDHDRSSRHRHRRHDRDGDLDSHHQHRYRHHSRGRVDEEDQHRHKRSRHSNHNDEGRKECSQDPDRNRLRAEEEHITTVAEHTIVATPEVKQDDTGLKRDAWMEAPSALDVDYVQPRRPNQPQISSPPYRMLRSDFGLKIHEKELNSHLRDIAKEEGPGGEDVGDEYRALKLEQLSAQHEVHYTFGDAGSRWRMMKLRAVYRQAEESGMPVEKVAVERFGDLRSFDDAREEEIELDRREMYGEGYVGKEKPTGQLFQERKLDAGIRRRGSMEEVEQTTSTQQNQDTEPPPDQGAHIDTEPVPQALDPTALNKLKAQMMKAKMRGLPNAAELEAQYNTAMVQPANRQEPDVVVLGVMENRMLAGGKRPEVKPIDNKRGRERGLVEENEHMSIEDMVREERRTRGQPGGEGHRFAERIAKDAKFGADLDYMEDNAWNLAKRVHRSDTDIKNTAINEFQKMNRILESCPLCYREDTGAVPVAPVISLATRVYLTLPTEPELSDGGACIVPLQHHTNLLECDDDEWEEVRNFMKSLTRMYHGQGRAVIFYENAARPQQKRHAAMQVIPLPYDLGQTSPAFFKEAILAADEEWTQHKKVIDTLANARQGMGKLAFRRSLAKEIPYFHVWFEMDGGLAHVVEDSNRWPRGDLFAREVVGGMLDLPPDVIKRQGRWNKGGGDGRVEGFKMRWRKFDWTRVLTEGA